MHDNEAGCGDNETVFCLQYKSQVPQEEEKQKDMTHKKNVGGSTATSGGGGDTGEIPDHLGNRRGYIEENTATFGMVKELYRVPASPSLGMSGRRQVEQQSGRQQPQNPRLAARRAVHAGHHVVPWLHGLVPRRLLVGFDLSIRGGKGEGGRGQECQKKHDVRPQFAMCLASTSIVASTACDGEGLDLESAKLGTNFPSPLPPCGAPTPITEYPPWFPGLCHFTPGTLGRLVANREVFEVFSTSLENVPCHVFGPIEVLAGLAFGGDHCRKRLDHVLWHAFLPENLSGRDFLGACRGGVGRRGGLKSKA
ncbi:hypothetical protein BDK51DRAFT_33989 [Blyttiomyces helicus]|uniref:Uncharacterized protein n=1 Tax=Blyttiomyces helicus TaxID=388810 RepID=A0A4P9WNM2_9FUNG|nr:hypothetical protein BDK51DRAFT_33989 [Blyttiomyces helicus]|eukprot:RKO94092.1 hypothetical protein BDK51DRAFT_33989 [Blyttiomyces helicus]